MTQCNGSDRLALANDLMHAVGRYHDEDGVDRRYIKAARLLREADAELRALPAQLADEMDAQANIDPQTRMRWVPISTVRAIAAALPGTEK